MGGESDRGRKRKIVNGGERMGKRRKRLDWRVGWRRERGSMREGGERED